MSYPIPPRQRRTLLDFEIGKQIGEGSLSVVHVAEEKATKMRFAVKVFCRQYLRSNRKDADVTMEEHCLRRINHPGIAKLHAEFREEAQWYLVLEYCPGGELWEIVKDVGCSDRVARHYLSQAMEAISYLRDTGVVHRDLKAENVLIGTHGNAKLVDFGSAKDVCNPHIKGAGTRSFKRVLEDNVGTPNFMAPEVVKNKFSDFRSDMWSFGCMVYQVLSGLPPFGTNLLKIYNRSLKARLPIPPGISRDGTDLIQRMVVLNPNERLGAADVREVRAHAFFRSMQCEGSRFEGSHRQPAPVPALEELCLRVIGRRWEHVGPRAATHAVMQEGSVLRNEARSSLARFQGTAERAERERARSKRREDPGEAGSSASSGDERAG